MLPLSQSHRFPFHFGRPKHAATRWIVASVLSRVHARGPIAAQAYPTPNTFPTAPTPTPPQFIPLPLPPIIITNPPYILFAASSAQRVIEGAGYKPMPHTGIIPRSSEHTLSPYLVTADKALVCTPRCSTVTMPQDLTPAQARFPLPLAF